MWLLDTGHVYHQPEAQHPPTIIQWGAARRISHLTPLILVRIQVPQPPVFLRPPRADKPVGPIGTDDPRTFGHGRRSRRREGAKTGYYDYADIDDDFISIHHYLKWYKFGFTRTYDNLALEIRNGRLTRDEAIAVLRARGDETPHEDIARFCAFVGISRERFFEIIEKFRNREVWSRRGGKWVIEDFLIPDWRWA